MANVYSTVQVDAMKRSQFNRRVPHKTSIPFGKWTPILKVQEVLPHDTWRLDVKGILRMLTPLVPIMDDISFDVCSFFVPYNIIWNKAKQLFGENDQVAWDLPAGVDFPVLTIEIPVNFFTAANYNTFKASSSYKPESQINIVKNGTVYTVLDNGLEGTELDFYGLPVDFNKDILGKMYVAGSSATSPIDKTFVLRYEVNALPFRANQMIYNNWFRNANITDPIKEFNYDDNDSTVTVGYEYSVGHKLFALHKARRYMDLFTACMPSPQRGPSVSVISGSSPLEIYNLPTSDSSIGTADRLSLRAKTTGISRGESGEVSFTDGDNIGYPFVDAANFMATVNQVRYAFATQRYYEKLINAPTYRDYVKVMFGVSSEDLSIQIPKLLGSKHFHVNINQVLSTTETLKNDNSVSNPVGSTGAVSATGFADHVFSNSFSQHGLIMTYICIRKEHTYCQGLDKFWTKKDIWDLYAPSFAHIGEVPVATKEVYWDPSDTGSIKNDDVLGYNEAWYEYRYDRPIVTGLLNPLNKDSGQLSAFTLVDVLEGTPTLDDSFIMEDPNGLDRSLVASANVTQQFIADLLGDFKTARVMPVHSVPGMLDHF